MLRQAIAALIAQQASENSDSSSRLADFGLLLPIQGVFAVRGPLCDLIIPS